MDAMRDSRRPARELPTLLGDMDKAQNFLN